MDDALPIDAVLGTLLTALDRASNAVLVAPPGAGKTTAVAPALLRAPWCTGEILLLSPRRIAARAAAERMAAVAGQAAGRTYGYATRLDTRRSAATRVTVMTQGIFVNRIQADPELAGVSAVLFDEVHERSLDGDFALALALDVQAALRPELRLVAMSATLDGARFAELMHGAPVIESAGRAFPLDIVHLGRGAASSRIEDDVAAAIRRALTESQAGILAFLPGVAEIERTARALGAIDPAVIVHHLHGGVDPSAQRAAIRADPSGRRKIVLATAIAETSLTLDGVAAVVDAGLARRPRYDRGAGMTRLVTERASQAAVAQRAGRAARQAPGRVYRLWEEAANAGLPRFDPPEIAEADLSALILACAIWGEADPRRLRWLDPPGGAAIDEGRRRLRALGAIDADARPTPHGRMLATLPLPPRLGHMLIAAEERGLGAIAADVAVLLSERGLGGNEVDLEVRWRRWRGDRGPRADAARGLARRWAALVATGTRHSNDTAHDPDAIGTCVALAFPDRVARRRGGDGADWIAVGGRGLRLDPAAPLAGAVWLAVADLSGSAAGARILAAAAIDDGVVEALFGGDVVVRRDTRFDPASGAVEAVRERMLGAIRLAHGPDDAPPPEALAAALLAGVRTHGVALLPWSEAASALRARVGFLRGIGDDLPALDNDGLAATIDDWLAPLLVGRRRLGAIDPVALDAALRARIGWDRVRAVDARAPLAFTAPAGSTHAIDYLAEGGPTVTLRPQALFGLDVHPTVAGGRVPLILSLTSPAGRPIQTTRDLPGFWRGSWAEVVREMRGRYPRHPWPDRPDVATATLRTKAADARQRSNPESKDARGRAGSE